jgi:hypothetical protein
VAEALAWIVDQLEPALWLGRRWRPPPSLVFFAPAGSLGRAVAIGLVAAAVGFGLDRLAHREPPGTNAQPSALQHQC